MSYIQIEKVGKSFSERQLFADVSFSIEKGQKVALIAKNGTGKTTLLRMIAGLESCETGAVVMEKGVTLAYLPQEPVFDGKQTVIEAVLHNSTEHRSIITEYRKALELNDAQMLSEAMNKMDASGAWDLETRLSQILGNLDLYNLNQTVGTLSGGEKKRLAIATAFIDAPDFIILDEPTNHLDLKSIEWLEQHLSKSKQTILMVTHDRYFLDRVCSVIVEIDQGKVYQYQGNFSYFLDKRAERIEVAETAADKAQSKLKQETEWASRMPKARTTKAKYRLDAIDELRDAARVTKDDALEINTMGKRLGKKLINLIGVSHQFGDKKLVDNFSYQFLRGEKVGIVGENGIGKTTFINIVAGRLKPNRGEVEVGETIHMAYYEQNGIAFDETLRVIDVARDVAEVVETGGAKPLPVERFLNRFLFPNEMHYQLISKLSGGEKRRLYLATILMTNPNFLILDEPTNDLDIMTLGVLENYLDAFQGTVLIVSHDRFFMDRIVDHIFEFKGDGQIKDFPGNYSQLRSDQAARAKSVEANAKPKDGGSIKKRAKTKLSFHEQKELDGLELEIENLNAQKSMVEQQLANPTGNPDELTSLSIQFESICAGIEEKEMRWLELTELKEQLEAGK